MLIAKKSFLKDGSFFNALILFLLKSEVFLIPLFFVPFTFEIFEFNKQNILWLFTLFAFVLWIFKVVVIEKKIIYKKTPLDIPIVIFLSMWALSAIFSVDWFSSVFGYYGRFSDAYLSTISFALFYFLAVNNVTKKDVSGFLNVFLFSGGLALSIGLLSLTGVLAKLAGNVGGRFAVLNSPSFNTIGGASEPFALFAAAVFVLSVALYSYNVRGRKKLLLSSLKYYIAGLLSLVVLVIINFTLSWVALVISLAFLFIFALYIVYLNRDDESITVEVNITPALSFFVLGLLFLFLFGGTGSLFGVNLPREAVLPVDTAKTIAWSNFKTNPVFGYGPGAFSYAFSAARPADFNSSQFWQLRFDKSPAYILELVSTVGVAGVLAYVAIIGVYLFVTFMFLRNIFRTSQEESYVAFGFAFMSLSLFITQILYLTNTVLLFMFWFSIAIAMINWRFAFSKIFVTKEIDLQKYKDMSPILTVVLVVVIFILVLIAFLQVKYYLADINYNNYRLSGNVDFARTAVKLNHNRLNYHLALARNYLGDSQTDIASLSSSGQKTIDGDQKSALQNNIQSAIKEAEAGSEAAPNSVMAWELLASIYRDVRLIAIGSVEPAIRYFQKACELEPTNPILWSELGKMYLAHNQTDEAVSAFERAIANKVDYTDAYVGLAKTYETLGQPDKALVILEEANRIRLNAEVVYESGRLYYNQNNFDMAIERFLQAIDLRPGYANAMFSLGLAYQKAGDKQNALEQFENVLKLNPENEAVVKMIAEIKSKQ